MNPPGLLPDPYGDLVIHHDPPPGELVTLSSSGMQVVAASQMQLQGITGTNVNEQAASDTSSLDILNRSLVELSGLVSGQDPLQLPNQGHIDPLSLDSLTGLSSNSSPESTGSPELRSNLSPLLDNSFKLDQFLQQRDGSEIPGLASHNQARTTAADSYLVSGTALPLKQYTLTEDKSFSIDLHDLFPDADLIQSVEIQSDGTTMPDWIHYAEHHPDHTLLDKVVIEAKLKDTHGQLLSEQDIVALSKGSQVRADLLVSDNRATASGLLGLNLDLAWNPKALKFQDTELVSELPLFRDEGTLDLVGGTLQGLQAASLPNAGSGSILGDQPQELFASLNFTVGDIGEDGLGISLQPRKLPTSQNQSLLPGQVLAIGSHSTSRSLLEGTATQAQVGSRDVLVQVTDANGRQWRQSLLLMVSNINDAPVATGIPMIEAQEESPLIIRLADYFHDDDIGDRLTYHWHGAQPSWLQLDSETGVVTGFPDDAEIGPWNLTVEARDISGYSTNQKLELSVQNINDAPRWSGESLPEILIRADREFSINLPRHLFADNDQYDSLQYSLAQLDNSVVPSWLTIDSQTAGISGIAPAMGEPPHQIRLLATDNSGASDSILLNIQTVDQTYNRTPYLTKQSLSNISILEGESLEFNLRELFQDDDRLIGDKLRFDIQAPSWLHFDRESALLRGIADNDAVGQSNVTIRAIDLDGASVASSFILSVINVNQAPEVSGAANANLMLQTGSNYELDLDSIFSDKDSIHGDWMNYSLQLKSTSGLGTPGWLTWNSKTGVFQLSPADTDRGLLSVIFTATDRAGAHADYRLEFAIVSGNGLIEVARAIPSIVIQPNETRDYDISTAFVQSRNSDTVAYSAELLRREADGSYTSVSPQESEWIELVDHRVTDLIDSQPNRILIEPQLRRVDNGQLIRPEDLHALDAGTALQLTVSIHDLRQSSQLRGVVGLDLNLNWAGLTLDPALDPVLTKAINPLFPLFQQADLIGSSRQSLHVSAASLPAIGVGQVLGDGSEDFLTLTFRLIDPNQPVRIEMSLNDETAGGLGIGLADGTNAQGQMQISNWSPNKPVEMRLHPTSDNHGNYAVRVTASIDQQDSVSQIIALKVGNLANTPPLSKKDVATIAVKDNVNQVLALDELITDPNGDRLSYSLNLNGNSDADERLLRDAVYLVIQHGQDGLAFDVPGLTRPIRGELTVTADDGQEQTSQVIQLQLDPRSQTVPISAAPIYPAVNTSQYLGLGKLYGARPINILDPHDDTVLYIRTQQPSSLRLSNQFLTAFGWTPEYASAIQVEWTTSVSNDGYVQRIPINSLLQKQDQRSLSFDLDWLEVLTPDRTSLASTIDIKTATTVEGDTTGQIYGLSASTWYSALMTTRSAWLNSRPINGPDTELYLNQLLTTSGSDLSRLVPPSVNAADRQDLSLLAWRTQANFEAAINSDLRDISSIAALQVGSFSYDNGILDSELPYRISDICVLGLSDPYFEGLSLSTNQDVDQTLEAPWDPLYFSVTAADSPQLLIDTDKDRSGTQVVVDIDISMAGLKAGDLNGFRKFVSSSTLATASSMGLTLRDLDSTPITQPGWYDFMMRLDHDGTPVGDGAEFMTRTSDGITWITGIRIHLTDNSFGDNNLRLGIIDDPIVPVKIVSVSRDQSAETTTGPESTSQSQSNPSSLLPVAPGSLVPPPQSTQLASVSPNRDSTAVVIAARSGQRSINESDTSLLFASHSDPLMRNSSGFFNSAGLQAVLSSSPSPASVPTTHGNDNGHSAVHPSGPQSPDAELPSNLGSRTDPRFGSHLPKATQPQNPINSFAKSASSALDHIRDHISPALEPGNFIAGLLLGMIGFPNGVERSIKSLLLESGIGDKIRLQRRSLELQARWSVTLHSNTHVPLHFLLNLEGGRLQLHLLKDHPVIHSGLDSISPLELNGSAIWGALQATDRPGELIRQIEQRLNALLDPMKQASDHAWISWLHQLENASNLNLVPGLKHSMQALRQSVQQAQSIDPSMADAMMTVELLHCHVRLGGQLPWLNHKPVTDTI